MWLDIGILVAVAVVGIALLMLEIFFIPGITLAGIAGALLLIGEIAYGYALFGAWSGHVILLLNGLGFILSFYLFTRSRMLQKLSLHTNIDACVPTIDRAQVMEGTEGITVSRLNPMGKIEIGGEYYEAKSPEGFVDEHTAVTVTRVFATHVEVEIKLNL